MKNWKDYKEHVKSIDAISGKDISDMEEHAAIITAIIKARQEKGLSQRDLAAICDMPQSSVARIESFQTTPNLSTLLKILHSLELRLVVMK